MTPLESPEIHTRRHCPECEEWKRRALYSEDVSEQAINGLKNDICGAKDAYAKISTLRQELSAALSRVEKLREALEACVAVIPNLEVRSWPPGFELKKKALLDARAALSTTPAQDGEGKCPVCKDGGQHDPERGCREYTAVVLEQVGREPSPMAEQAIGVARVSLSDARDIAQRMDHHHNCTSSKTDPQWCRCGLSQLERALGLTGEGG